MNADCVFLVTKLSLVTRRKSQQHRSQEQNGKEGLQRLIKLIKSVNVVPKKRIVTKLMKGSVTRRLQSKKKHAGKKRLRGEYGPRVDACQK